MDLVLVRLTDWLDAPRRLRSRGLTGAIGLHCGLDELHMVQFGAGRDGAGPEVRAAVSQSLADTVTPETAPAEWRAAWSDAIRSAREQQSFLGRRVVSCLPGSQTRIFPVSVRVKSKQDRNSALVAAVAERVEGPLSDYSMDVMPVRREVDADEFKGVVALAKREDVQIYLDMLCSAGLQPVRLEIGPLAIRRLVGFLAHTEGPENVIAINFGRDAAYISVISGRRLLLDQSIEFGEQRLLDRVARALDLTTGQLRSAIDRHGLYPEDGAATEMAATVRQIIQPVLLELVEEINRTLIYIASQTRGEHVRRVYLFGSIARWGGVDRLLQTLIHMDVELITDPLSKFDGGAANSAGPEVAVAAGLALSEMPHG